MYKKTGHKNPRLIFIILFFCKSCIIIRNTPSACDYEMSDKQYRFDVLICQTFLRFKTYRSKPTVKMTQIRNRTFVILCFWIFKLPDFELKIFFLFSVRLKVYLNKGETCIKNYDFFICIKKGCWPKRLSFFRCAVKQMTISFFSLFFEVT